MLLANQTEYTKWDKKYSKTSNTFSYLHTNTHSSSPIIVRDVYPTADLSIGYHRFSELENRKSYVIAVRFCCAHKAKTPSNDPSKKHKGRAKKSTQTERNDHYFGPSHKRNRTQKHTSTVQKRPNSNFRYQQVYTPNCQHRQQRRRGEMFGV